MEIGKDYPGFAAELSTLLLEGYQELTREASITGAGHGSNQPLGVLTALVAATSHVVVTSDGVFQAADIAKTWEALPDRAKGGASWLRNPSTSSKIASWGDAYGGRSVDLTGVPTTLRNAGIIESSFMPAFTGTTGSANILIVGNFRKFHIIQRAGMVVEKVAHLFDTTTGTPTSQRGMLAWARVSSTVVDPGAFRLLVNN